MKVFLCPSPELYQLYHRPEAIVIITDIFRASTTMVTALANGAAGILPVATVEETQALGLAKGYLMAAERQVRRCDFAHFGNDPLEYTPEAVSEQRIVLTTTNGTRSLRIALEASAKQILVGSFINLPQTIDYCHRLGSTEVVIVAAGWQGQVCAEDCLYAGAFATLAEKQGLGVAQGDMAVMMRDLWREHCQTLEARMKYIKCSEHYARLVHAGHADAAEYCMTIGSHDLVVGLVDTHEGWLGRL
ncbi:MAG: 2-phosphosulfolactate phosphatase [Porphyromonadaceae bacterium]|nr:2-phosphosulfolactate phosphatase [Porphyromonadaceae bacterium]